MSVAITRIGWREAHASPTAPRVLAAPGPGGRERHPQPAGGARVAVGRVGGGLLVAYAHQADRTRSPSARQSDRLCTPGSPNAIVHAGVLERRHGGAGACQDRVRDELIAASFPECAARGRAGGRPLPRARRALLHDGARRPRGRGGQGGAPGRRGRDARVGAAVRRRRVGLLPRGQPRQAQRGARPRRARRAASWPWTCAPAPTWWWRTSAPAAPSGWAWATRTCGRATRGRSTARSAASAWTAGPPGRPGYDFVLQAESGLMSITGPADGEPHKVGVALVDVMAGLHAAVAVLAAVHGGRGRQGGGAAARQRAREPRERGAGGARDRG